MALPKACRQRQCINYVKSKGDLRTQIAPRRSLNHQAATYTLKFFLRTGTRKNTVIYMRVATNELQTVDSTMCPHLFKCSKLSRSMSTTKFSLPWLSPGSLMQEKKMMFLMMMRFISFWLHRNLFHPEKSSSQAEMKSNWVKMAALAIIRLAARMNQSTKWT